MKVTVQNICELSPRIRSYKLFPLSTPILPGFSAGAHIDVPVVLADGVTSTRSYSLVSDPGCRDHYEIAVQLDKNSVGGSRFMHSKVREGQTLDISIPKNNFPLADVGNHNILLAGGIGITPLISMMHNLIHMNVSFELHYTARQSRELIYQERIKKIAGGHANFYVSRNKQRLNLDAVCSKMPTGTQIYACGPTNFLLELHAMEDIQKIPTGTLHTEKFGTPPPTNNSDFTAILSKSGKTLAAPKGKSLLSALTDTGIYIPYDCMRGECGMCAIPYSNGTVNHRDNCLSNQARERKMCPCVSEVLSKKIVLDL